MSESSLQAQIKTNERLKQDMERSKNVMKVSEASGELINSITSKPDPFLDSWDSKANPNPWKAPPGGSICQIL